jgi:hypothetical protein
MKKDKPDKNHACAFIRSHLISIAEGGISWASFPGVKGHLDSCPGCASLVRQFSKAWDGLEPEEAQPSPDFFPGIFEMIETDERSLPGRPGVFSIAWRFLKPAAVAAIFLGGIFAGHELGKRDRAILPPETAFSGQALKSFVNIPPGSVADFYVSRQNSEKEGLE